MRVGKSGLTDSVVVELEGQLSSRSLVKVKVNRGLYAKDDLNTVWNVMAEKTNSSVVFARGNVAVFLAKLNRGLTQSSRGDCSCP